jgi:serine/threonine protein kinase
MDSVDRELLKKEIDFYQTFLTKVGLDNIKLIEKIGSGSYSKVFKAKLKNDKTDSIYAVKITEPPVGDYIPEITTIKNYYKIIYNCCPDCLVTLFPEYIREGKYLDGGKEKKFLVVVSQYVPKTLEDLKGKPEPKKVISLILKLIECLKAFSAEGLLYTDLKPQNLGTPERITNCKIIDIGGFKSLERLKLAKETLTKNVGRTEFLYTFKYAPPELDKVDIENTQAVAEYVEKELKEGKGYVYTLGVILGELLELIDYDYQNHQWRIVKDTVLTPLLVEALNPDREERPSLAEFERLLKHYLNLLQGVPITPPEGEEKKVVKIPKGETLELPKQEEEKKREQIPQGEMENVETPKEDKEKLKTPKRRTHIFNSTLKVLGIFKPIFGKKGLAVLASLSLLSASGWVAYNWNSFKPQIYAADCDLGVGFACYELGEMFFKGLDVEKDYVEAKKWFEKACNKGIAQGCLSLA